MTEYNITLNHVQRKLVYNALKSFFDWDTDKRVLTRPIRRALDDLLESFNPSLGHLESGKEASNDLSVLPIDEEV